MRILPLVSASLCSAKESREGGAIPSTIDDDPPPIKPITVDSSTQTKISEENDFSVKAISILHDMGISVTHSTIHKKKKILVKQQEERIKATAQAYTEQRKLILLGQAVIDSDLSKK
uniref:Uncharacterized protein n=1 Tax=Magallana gigas TaxID=29159 RepID=K1RGI4_MAGGI